MLNNKSQAWQGAVRWWGREGFAGRHPFLQSILLHQAPSLSFSTTVWGMGHVRCCSWAGHRHGRDRIHTHTRTGGHAGKECNAWEGQEEDKLPSSQHRPSSARLHGGILFLLLPSPLSFLLLPPFSLSWVIASFSLSLLCPQAGRRGWGITRGQKGRWWGMALLLAGVVELCNSRKKVGKGKKGRQAWVVVWACMFTQINSRHTTRRGTQRE